MAILTIIAKLLFLKSDTISNLCFSAIILLIISPLIVYDVGFVLSFGGTIGIILLSKNLQKIFKKFSKASEILAVSCSAQIVLVPIMMYYFNSCSIISIVTNLLVVPISGLITILGFLVFIISKIFFPIAKFISYSLLIPLNFKVK